MVLRDEVCHKTFPVFFASPPPFNSHHLRHTHPPSTNVTRFLPSYTSFALRHNPLYHRSPPHPPASSPSTSRPFSCAAFDTNITTAALKNNKHHHNTTTIHRRQQTKTPTNNREQNSYKVTTATETEERASSRAEPTHAAKRRRHYMVRNCRTAIRKVVRRWVNLSRLVDSRFLWTSARSLVKASSRGGRFANDCDSVSLLLYLLNACRRRPEQAKKKEKRSDGSENGRS